MSITDGIQVGAAAVSLLIGVSGLAYGAHRILGRIERAVLSAEANTQELRPNGGGSIKDELTVGRGGMVDRQMRLEEKVTRAGEQVETLVDALATVRARLVKSETSLKAELAEQNAKVAGRLDQVTDDMLAVRRGLETHITVAEAQVFAISTALLHLGVDPGVAPGVAPKEDTE